MLEDVLSSVRAQLCLCMWSNASKNELELYYVILAHHTTHIFSSHLLSYLLSYVMFSKDNANAISQTIAQRIKYRPSYCKCRARGKGGDTLRWERREASAAPSCCSSLTRLVRTSLADTKRNCQSNCTVTRSKLQSLEENKHPKSPIQANKSIGRSDWCGEKATLRVTRAIMHEKLHEKIKSNQVFPRACLLITSLA